MNDVGASAHCDTRAQQRCADHPPNYLSLLPPLCTHKPTIRFGTDNRRSHRTRRRCCCFVSDTVKCSLSCTQTVSNSHDSRSLIEISRSHPRSLRECAAKIPTKTPFAAGQLASRSSSSLRQLVRIALTSLSSIVLLLNLAAFVSSPSIVDGAHPSVIYFIG